ncbi:ABC transporter substrate-binding protein [Streptococcus pneumoniae]|nr:ABC transporter substrate-binding protein [Streptococcus pneumoniae]
MKNSIMDTKFDRRILLLNKIIIVFIVLMTLLPLLYIVVASFMDPKVLVSRGISFNPADWTVEGYQRVFSDQSILRGFINSLLYSFGFAALTVLLSVFTAYPLSKKDLVGRRWINYFLIVTMFFGGGLVPTYLLVKELGMLNTPWAIIVPGAVNVWNIILARAYFQGLPEELVEAAVIDGANDLQIFFKIMLPLAKPIMFVLFLYAFVGQWNSYFDAMIYIKDPNLEPLQLVLRKILIQSQPGQDMIGAQAAMNEMKRLAELIKYATIVISSLPLIVMYPFFQNTLIKELWLVHLKDKKRKNKRSFLMKFKTFSKSAVLLTASLAVLAACGSKNTASSPDYKLEGVTFPLQEKKTLKFMTASSPLSPKDPNEKLILQRLEKETGVHIDWTNYQSDFAEKRNLDISSGDLPDAIHNDGASDVDLMNWAKKGVIIPVEDLIDKYMPNLKKILDEKPEYKALMTAPDGHIYSFPWIEELGDGKESIHSVNDMAWINKDWLKKLGLEMPKTTDDLIKVLEAFKNGDPNGNGEADEIPFSFISGNGNEDFKFLFAAFGIGDNDDHLVVGNDGKVDFTADNDNYKEGVKFIRQLQEKGLIDKEAFEHDWNSYIAKGHDQKFGVYFTWDKNNVTGSNESYDVLPVLAGPSGQKHVARTNGMGFARDKMVITSVNKNLELTAKWIDAQYAPLQSVQNNWGTYGDDKQQNIFELDQASNSLKHLPLNGTAPAELRQKTEVGGPLAILDSYYGKVTTMPDDAKWRLDLIKEYYVPYMSNVNNYPRVFMTQEDLDKIAHIEADMNDYIYRKRAEWIVNGNIDTEWDDYKKELEKYGLSDYLAIKQKYYDQYQANKN